MKSSMEKYLVNIDSWKKYFPFDVIRPEQETAINFAIKSYVEDCKKAVIIDASTGSGKSAIAITLARYLDAHASAPKDEAGMPLSGAYIITTQKILQAQYTKDFGPESGKDLVRTIKSSSNYRCHFYKDNTCAESKRLLAKLGKQLKGTEFEKQCKNDCEYSKDKQAFIDSQISVTNFSYFLAETTYAGKLEPRALLITDEAHNLESELSKFIEVSFSEKFARDVLKCKVPRLDTQEAVFEWIRDSYKKSLVRHVKSLEKNLVKLSASIDGYSAFSKQYEILDKHCGKVDKFLDVYSENNWVMNITYPAEGNRRGARKFEFKPIDVSKYSKDVYFRSGGRLLLMSATIVDKDVFCDSVGIDVNDAAYLRLPSTFPIENSPIHYLPTGSMSRNSIEKTLPVLAETVKMILENHKNEKGVIHAVTYKVAKYIQETLKSDRILTHDSTNRDEILKKHMESTEPTVLLSPSMMEGVDLADNASRFQILCKVPYPYLGDLVVKKRMERNKSWYPYCTAKSVIQSMGRSVRNNTDYAVSYILDSDWSGFYARNSYMLPDEFKKAIK